MSLVGICSVDPQLHARDLDPRIADDVGRGTEGPLERAPNIDGAVTAEKYLIAIAGQAHGNGPSR